MTLGDPPNPTSFTLFITVKSSKKFASVFWRAHYRVKKFLQWLPPTMGPSAPIKGFAFGPSSTHLEGAFRQSPAHNEKRPLHGVANLGCWRVKLYVRWSPWRGAFLKRARCFGQQALVSGNTPSVGTLHSCVWFLVGFFPNSFWMWRTLKSNNWSCNQSICRWINSPRFLTIIIPWQLWKFDIFFFHIFS